MWALSIAEILWLSVSPLLCVHHRLREATYLWQLLGRWSSGCFPMFCLRALRSVVRLTFICQILLASAVTVSPFCITFSCSTALFLTVSFLIPCCLWLRQFIPVFIAEPLFISLQGNCFMFSSFCSVKAKKKNFLCMNNMLPQKKGEVQLLVKNKFDIEWSVLEMFVSSSRNI